MQVAGVRLSCEGEKEFSAALRQAATEAKRTGRDLQKLDATYGKGSKNTDYLTQKQELLTRQLEQQRKRTETLRQVRESYLASGNADAAKLGQVKKFAVLMAETKGAGCGRDRVFQLNAAKVHS